MADFVYSDVARLLTVCMCSVRSRLLVAHRSSHTTRSASSLSSARLSAPTPGCALGASDVASGTRQLLTRYPKAKRLLDTDSACVGVFNAEVGNAELSNALATTLWELHVLTHSWHPALATAAKVPEALGTSARYHQVPELSTLRYLSSVPSGTSQLRVPSSRLAWSFRTAASRPEPDV
eukprot:1689637-Rhodomonas_salina.2